MKNKDDYKLISSEVMYEGNVVQVRHDVIELENGVVANRDVVCHPGGVGIALEDDDGKFFMVKQFRYAIQEETLEFPAGKIENNEDPLEAAKREIIEETGYEGEGFIPLGKIVPTPAYDNEVIHIFYAKKGLFLGQNLDEDESLNTLTMGFEDISQEIRAGNIVDAKTIGMMQLIQAYKEKEDE